MVGYSSRGSRGIGAKIVAEQIEAGKERLPRRVLRQQDDRIAGAADVDPLAFEAKVFGQAYGLALSVGEESGGLHISSKKI